MKKFLNKFLNKKSDFIEDPKLRALNEEFVYIWDRETKLLNYILPLNVRYFFKFKKLYVAKLLLIGTLYFGVFGGIIGAGLFALNYFNIISISNDRKYIFRIKSFK